MPTMGECCVRLAGTMTDNEMREMKILMQAVQPEHGVLFMWITGQQQRMAAYPEGERPIRVALCC